MNTTIINKWNSFRSFLTNLWKHVNPFSSNNCERILSFVQKNIVIIVLLLLYFCFIHFWEDLIGDHIINKFLCHFESIWYNDCLFLVAIACCAKLCRMNWGKNIKMSAKIVCFAIFVLWIYYRCFSPICGLNDSSYYIIFKRLSIFKGIKYLQEVSYIDIIPIIALCKLIPLLGIKETFFSFHGGYDTDHPIQKSREDLLARHNDAETITDQLLKTDTSKESFSLGIDSPWGTGKTSFMNLMKEKINTKHLNETIVIDFNPWQYPIEKDLVSVFFDDLSKQLKRYDKTLAKSIINYSKVLSAFNTSETRLISSLFDLAYNDNSLQETKRSIINAIKHIRKKIVVFIDDLDRLDSKELMEMLKLIRNISDFPYMYFVAAYDKSYILNSLAPIMPSKETSFITKIFQHEIKLAELGHLISDLAQGSESFFYKYFIDVVSGTDKNELLTEIRLTLRFNYLNSWNYFGVTNTIPSHALSNIREMMRLSNNFKKSYDKLKGKIEVCNLFWLELLKLKYPIVYSVFVQKKDEYIIKGTSPNEDFYFLCSEQNISEDESDSSSQIIFSNYLKKHKDQLFISDLDIDLIMSILFRLFPQQPRLDRGIQNSHYTDRYFYHNDTIIHDDPFDLVNTQNRLKELITTKKDFAEIKKEIFSWAKDDPEELIYYISSCNTDDAFREIDLRKKLIRVVLYFLSLNTPLQLKTSDFTNLFEKQKELKAQLLNDKDIIADLKEYQYNSVVFKSLCYFRFPDNPNIQSIVTELFKKYLDNKPNIVEVINCFLLIFDKYFVHLYRKTNPTINTELQNVRDALRTYVSHHLLDFIETIIIPLERNNYRLDNDVINMLFSWDEFSNMINEQTNSSTKSLKEFQGFLEKYREKDCSKSVHHTFTNIKVTNKHSGINKELLSITLLKEIASDYKSHWE